MVAGPGEAEPEGDGPSEAVSGGESGAARDSESDSQAESGSEGKYDSGSESKRESKSSSAEKPEPAGPPLADGKNFTTPTGKASAVDDGPRGAHEVPIARRDDFGAPGQGAPLNVIAAYIAAADGNDRERAFALMTAECAERERTWAKSFSRAIFDRGYRFQVVRLSEDNTEDERAEIRLRVVFLDHQGEPDNEGMRFKLLRRDGQWWVDEIR